MILIGAAEAIRMILMKSLDDLTMIKLDEAARSTL